MYKVLKSYTKKATRKHEVNGQTIANETYQDSQQQVDTNPAMNHSKSGNGSVSGSHYSTAKTNGNIPIERIGRDQMASGFSGAEESTYHSGSQYRTSESRHHNNNHRQNNDIMPYSSNNGNYSMNRHYDTAYNSNFGQGFSESSSYETREHYERKVQRVKKTRGERERNSFRSKNKYGSKNVSEVLRHTDNVSARDALLQWARKATEGYPGVNVSNFTNSWRDGLAFNAILHRYRPNLIDWSKISDKNVSARMRLDNAFNAAEKEFGVSKLLDAEDVDCDHPDEKSVITYVSSLYNALPHLDELSKYMNAMDDYIRLATLLRQWILEVTSFMEIKNENLYHTSPLLLLEELDKFKLEDLPPKAEMKEELSREYDALKKAFERTEYFQIPIELSSYAIEEIWENLLRAIHFRNRDLIELAGIQSNLNDLINKLNRGIGITNEKLDLILNRIEDIEARAETINVHEGERIISEIIDDLNALEPTINGFFDDVEVLKNNHHPEENNMYKQVYGLHQRREAYLDRIGGSILSKFNIRTETIRRENIQRLEAQRETSFRRVEECIEWVRVRMERLNNMDFNLDLEQLEDMFENHKLENRDIQDFRQDVDECIARQAEVTVEDSYEYCELLRTLESEYQQLRDLSAGRMLDLDSLIAFIRAAQIELIWISQREDIEVSRNWSDINQLDLPMLQNYYKQLLHEIELREKQFNDVHNQGAALINQRHPAVELIESYLRCMSSQWEWLLSLSKALEGHLRDALNLRSFMEEADKVEQWMKLQTEHLEKNYNHTDFSLDEGEQYLAELNEIKEMLNKYHGILMGLTEKSSQISPLWQRGERISRPIPVTALCDYNSKEINIRAGDECTLLNNDDMIYWRVRGIDGVEAKVPSVVFRIPPPDPKLTSFLNRLHASFEKMKKLWEKKHRMIRYNMILNTMKTIRNWDLDTFMSLDPDQRDAIIKALNEDTMKLLSEMDPNDPLTLRLREELRSTNEHFYNLLNESMKPPEPDHSQQFDEAFASLAKKLEEAWEKLTSRVKEPTADSMEALERNIIDHKIFEDALQSLDSDVSNVKELFRQILNPTPSQRANNDFLTTRWEDLWDLSRMYVDRLKALELVLNGIQEVNDIVKQHEITLSSFDDLPADLSRLRGAHSQLVELNMILQQQQSVVDSLNKNIALLRQHVARTRYNAPNHPDVDALDEQVQNLTVRWENVSSQVQERMRACEKALQIQMVYRSEYQCEMDWLDRVESTINSLRHPDKLRPEEYQRQLDTLIAEYSQLQERTEAIEKVNREGGKFIREAKTYDNRLGVFRDSVIDIHGHGIKSSFRRQIPQPLNGADQVTEELEKLNRRFAQLSSFILEKRNEMQVLIQNWKKKKQEEEDRKRAELEAQRQAFEQARRKALEEADRLRAEREEAERLRREQQAERERKRLQDEADRLRREQEAERERQRLADEADRLRREQEELDRLRREKELADKLRKIPELNINSAFEMNQASNLDDLDEFDNLEAVPDKAKISEYEDEMQTYSEETETKTQFYEMEGVLHKQTGEILTFVEAIRQGLLDLHSNGGEFFDIHTGAKISLEKAAELGFIKESFNDLLNKKLGIHHPETKQSLTLLEAIQQNLYNPETRQITDIHSGEVLFADELMSKGILTSETQIRLITAGVLKFPPMSLEHAIEQGVLDVETGEFKGKYSSTTLSLQDSLINSYIKISSGSTPMIAVTLSDVIDNGLINGATGEFRDKNSDDKFNLREACSKKTNLLNRNIKEITKTDNLEKISLGDATVRNVINTRAGNFTDTENKQGVTLQQARDKGWISKPMTLYELVKRDQIDSTNHFIDKGSRQRFSLLQSIAYGLIDPDVRHIVDIEEKDVISLSEALERGIIEADGLYHIVGEKKTLSLYEALGEGLLTMRAKHSIFDVKGINNTETGVMINLREAINEGIIIPQSERFIDVITKDSFSLPQAAERGFIDKALYELISSPIGMKDSYGSEMNIIRGVSEGVIDLDKGVVIVKEHGSTRELNAFDAYHNGHLSLRGAMKLAALLDIPPTLVATRRKVDGKKRIRRPGQHHVLGDDQVKITLAEAMKQGLIDSRTQRFRQGDIDISLDEALSQGLLSENSEWIIPAKALGTGPTIEEKVDESVTETAQQLAPKIFPDKNIEESVTTVKRVRRTETSALGGPGGVSVYRAITGSKGAVEVPTDGYHFREAERKGFIDLDKGIVTPPTTDKKLSIEDAVNIGFLDGSSITMTDPKTGREITAPEAFESKVMTPNGQVKHHGKQYSLKDAIENNIVKITFEPPVNNTSMSKKIIQFATGNNAIMSFKPVGTPMIEEHETSWSFDANTGELVDLTTNERINLDRALAKGKLSYDDLRVRDTITGREMSFAEAEKWGVVDAKNSYYLDKQNNHRLSFTEAAKQHKVYPAGGVPENAADAVHTTVKVQTRTAVSKKEAIPIGTNQFASLTIGKLVSTGNFDQSTGMFINPENKQQMTLKSMIMKGLIDPYGTTINDKKNYRELSLLDGIQENIVDDINGTVTDTTTGKIHDFRYALEHGLIKDKGLKDSFEDSLVSGRLSMTSGLYTTSDGNKITIPQAIRKDLLDGDSLVIKDPATGSHMTYNDAVSKRVVDPSSGHITNIQTEERMSFPKALTTGLISAAGATPVSSYTTSKGPQNRIIEQTLQFTPYSPEIQYEESSSSAALALRQPGDSSHKVVDLGGGKQVTVKVVRDANGLEKGEYVDPSSGMKFTIQLNSDPFVTETKTTVKSTAQVQSVELEPHAEFVGIDRIRDKRTDRVMSLADAERLGLAKVDKKGKQTTKTYAVFRSNIQTAVNKGVIDNNGDKISLQDAIKVGIIDIEKLTYKSANIKDELSLSQASNMGLVDITLSETLAKGISHPVNGEKISVKEGIDIGIINKYTGAVINPFTNEKLTWLDIVKPVYASLTMEGVYDPTKGYGIPITAALCEGLINAEENLYVNVISGDKFTIDQARAKGLIDGSTYKALVEPSIPNYKTGGKVNLIEAVKLGIFNPRNKTVQLNQFTVTPISKAVSEGKISKEIGDKLRQVERMSFVDALGKGNIDLVRDTFTDIDSGNQMTISQAVEQGYIDPGTIEKFSEGDEKNLSNVIKSDEFDENSGRIRDKQTGLYLTFKNAIEKGIIDGDSLIHDVDRSQTVTLHEAINRKKIDSDGKYIHKNGEKFNLTDAIKYGLIAIIASPMQAAQAVADAIKRRDAEGYKFKIESIPSESEKRHSSGPKWRTMETTTVKLTPVKNEPGLSTKIRSSVSDDIRRSRAASIIDDPQGLADLQFEFLDNLRKSNFNIDGAVIENPANNKRVSVREAAESGLLDIITGEIVNPKTGRRYSIPKAVHMKIMEPEAGKQIMENLNMTVEEISGPSHTSTHGSHVDDDGTRTSWSKTVHWSGNPSELRSKSPNIQTSYSESLHDEFIKKSVALSNVLNEVTDLVYDNKNTENIISDENSFDDQLANNRIKIIREYLSKYEKELSQDLADTDKLINEGTEMEIPSDELEILKNNKEKIKEAVSKLQNEEKLMSTKIADAKENETILNEWKKKKNLLMSFINENNKQLSNIKDNCKSTEIIQSLLPQLNDIEIEKATKKPLYEDIKKVFSLFKRTVPIPNLSLLKEEQHQLDEMWLDLDENLKKTKCFCNDSLNFFNDSETFKKWMADKDQLLSTIGRLSADSNYIEHQIVLLERLNDEFENNKINHKQLNDLSSSLLQKSSNNQYNDIITAKINDINEQWNLLQIKLNQAKNNLIDCNRVCQEFKNNQINIKNQLLDTEKQIDRTTFSLTENPTDLEEVFYQIDDICTQGANIVEPLIIDSENLLKQLIEMSGDQDIWKVLNNDLDSSKERVDKLIEKVQNIKNLSNVSKNATLLNERIVEMLENPIIKQPISNDIISLKHQQKELSNFRNNEVKSIGDETAKILESCKGILKVADKTLPCYNIEKLIDNIQNSWQELNKQLEVRDREISTKIQSIGNYDDAFRSLCNWLEETEELVMNQYKPSADSKVLRTELQNHNFQMKMIEDKQPNIDGFLKLMDKFVESAVDENEKNALKEKADMIDSRYRALVDNCNDRRVALQDALMYSIDWTSKTTELKQWLDDVNKDLEVIGKIATEPEKFEEQLEAQKVLKEEIDSKRPDFEFLVKIFNPFADLVSEDDGIELENTLNSLSERYDDVGIRCMNCGKSLEEMKENINSFLADTNDLSSWLDQIERELKKFDEIPISTDELIAQSEKLGELVGTITERENLVSRVVEDSRELCMHTSGPEAMQLQYRIDALHQRYSKIASLTDKKIDTMSTAIPLSEDYCVMYDDLARCLEKIEKELEHAEYDTISKQQELLQDLSKELFDNRNQLEVLNTKAIQLQGLSSEGKAEELKEQTKELQERFMELHDVINRKCERLNIVSSRHREIFDELDNLLDWFTDAHQHILDSKPPTVDIDNLKAQLKDQKVFNDDIISQKIFLREILGEASKYVKGVNDPTSISDNDDLNDKINKIKFLVDETSKLSEKRLEDLEEAYELCIVMEENFNDLNDWLDNMEEELSITDVNILSLKPEQLLKLKQQNSNIFAAIQTQKPMFEKFDKNVNSFIKLTSPEDAANLQLFADEIFTRYEGIANIVLKREQELNNNLEDSTLLEDRLNFMINNFENIAERIKNVDGIKAKPEGIKKQLLENEMIIKQIKSKEIPLLNLQEDATELLKKTPPNDLVSNEIAKNVDYLNSLWNDIIIASSKRDNLLQTALKTSEDFWNSYSSCHEAINNLKNNINQIPLDMSSDPNEIENNRIKLLTLLNDFTLFTPSMENMKFFGQNLSSYIDSDEKELVEHAISSIEMDSVDIGNLLNQLTNDFGQAIDKSTNYHTLFKKVMEFIINMEDIVYNLPPITATSIEDIQNELTNISNLRGQIDSNILLKEQLNSSAQDLLLTAQPNQIVAIRSPLNELNNRWNKIFTTISDRFHKLEKSLLETGQFSQAYDQIMLWIVKTAGNVDQIVVPTGDLRMIEINLSKINLIKNDVMAHEQSVLDLKRAGKSLISLDPSSENVIKVKLEELNKRWTDLNDTIDALISSLESAKNDASTLDQELDGWLMWLDDIESDLGLNKPIGGLPETARTQLDDFLVLNAQVEQKKDELNKLLDSKTNEGSGETWSQQQHNRIRKKWDNLKEKMKEKHDKLNKALEDAEKFQKDVDEISDFINYGENYVSMLPQISAIPETIQDQLQNHNEFNSKVENNKKKLGELSTKGSKLQFICEKKDAIPIKNKLTTMRHQFDKLNNKSNERMKNLKNALAYSTDYVEGHKDVTKWIKDNSTRMKEDPIISTTGDRIRDQLDDENNFKNIVAEKNPLVNNLLKKGKSLEESAPKSEKGVISKMNNSLTRDWDTLNDALNHRFQLLHDALLQNGKFEEALNDVSGWLHVQLPQLEKDLEMERLYGDVDNVNYLIKEHNKLKEDISEHSTAFIKVQKRYQEIKNKEPDALADDIKNEIDNMVHDWEKLNSLVADKDNILKDALAKAQDLDGKVNDLLTWIGKTDNNIKKNSTLKPSQHEEDFLREQIDNLEYTLEEIDSKEPDFEDLVNIGEEILQKVHPSAEIPVKDTINMITRRWDALKNIIKDKRDIMKESLKSFRDNEKLLDELTGFVEGKQHELDLVMDISNVNSLEDLANRFSNHENFKVQLTDKQEPIENAIKGYKKALIAANIIHQNEPINQDSKTDKKVKLGLLPTTHSQKYFKGDKLNNSWKNLWMNSMTYEQALQERKDYLEELKRLENFDFDEWKERYNEWNDHAKGRVTDLFRRIDKNGTGKVPRDIFIEAILASKFNTTPLEMEKVADIFDKGDGFIDAREFIRVLRIDPKKCKPKTDEERIDEEITRQAKRCTCAQRFPIKHLGASKGTVSYGFGHNTSMKRMVRILQSTVMVRVGGGWEEIDSFLIKHDPCRTKGRTNVELFYSGVQPGTNSDQIREFVSKSPKTSTVTPARKNSGIENFKSPKQVLGYPTQGPVTKIREKTEKSIPMFATPKRPSISLERKAHVNLLQHCTSDSRIPRPTTSLNSSSRSTSRSDLNFLTDSRPPSRCSDISDFSDRPPSRIPSLRKKKKSTSSHGSNV